MKVYTRFSQHPKYGAGGAERQMFLIGRELLKRNVEFHYFTRKCEKRQKNQEVIDGIIVHTLGTKIDASPRTIKEKVLNLINSNDLTIFFRYFKKLNFDICHLRGSSTIIGIWAFFVKFIKHKKFVYTISHIRHCIPGTLNFSRLNYKIFEYGIKKADVVVVLAEYMKKALYDNYGINSVVIKSGHPVPKDTFKKDTPPMILWISRLVEWKKPELFLKICGKLKDVNANFVLIGPGDFMKKEISEFSKKHTNFSFIPGVPSGKDNEYYERASLFINTSVNEGYPNSFIQSWLYKTPVMSLSVDPDSDIIKNNLGYHAKGNLSDLIDKIKEFVENPDKIKEMGKNCRKYAIKKHNIEKTAEQHFKLYKWLLEKH
jgi:glycosyltransferase involved in cell wall biosynthesis